MRIDEAATSSGLSKDTIRFYEKSGMLPPIQRDGRGWRAFRGSDLTWLKILERLRSTGMPLDDVKRFAASANSLECNHPDQQAMRLELLQKHAKTLAKRRAELDDCEAYLNHKISIYLDRLDRT